MQNVIFDTLLLFDSTKYNYILKVLVVIIYNSYIYIFIVKVLVVIIYENDMCLIMKLMFHLFVKLQYFCQCYFGET